MKKRVITITRSYGSGGRQVAKALSRELGIRYYDKDIINMASIKFGVNAALLREVDEKPETGYFKHYTRTEVVPPSSKDYLTKENLFNMTREVINDIADMDESAIILGRCAHSVLKDREDVIRVIIYADMDTMIKNAMHYDNISRGEALSRIDKVNKDREAYHKYFAGQDWLDARQYDICLNTSKLTIEQCVKVIEKYIEIMDELD